MTNLSTVKKSLPYFDTYGYSKKDDCFIVRKSFFYTMGKKTEDYVNRVLLSFPNATIVDSGEIWKSFRGGSTVAQGSHWYVKFQLPEDMTDKVLS
jgi:hypothetical protein